MTEPDELAEERREEEPELPDWIPRAGLEVVQLANALEHIRRSAYMHWLGDGFDPEHMKHISMLAAQALCGQPIAAPVDMASPEFKARNHAETERLMELFDDEIERAATEVAEHEHSFDMDPDRPFTMCCTVLRCTVLRQYGLLNHHPYRELLNPDGQSTVGIDEGISELIEALWAEGVRTYDSCQGGCARGAGVQTEPAYILFHPDDHDKVAAALAGFDDVVFIEPGTNVTGSREELVHWPGPWRCPDLEAERLIRSDPAGEPR